MSTGASRKEGRAQSRAQSRDESRALVDRFGGWWALLGSGEFEPWSVEVDRWALERASGDGRVLVLPTASAPEGDAVFEGWARKGLAHYREAGIAAEVVPLRTREDAGRADLAARVDGASAVFFSGGNPAYLAAVLAGTPFWAALVRAMARGLVFMGCSAGMACLSALAPDSDAEPADENVWRPGLGIFPDALLIPHWDALDTFQDGLTDLVVGSRSPGQTLVAVDERTALVGDRRSWRVLGHGRVHVLDDGGWSQHPERSTFERAL
jgi:cyanophycinase